VVGDTVDTRMSRMHRTRSVLAAIDELGERGWGPSNREIADRVAIRGLQADPLEMSHVLWCMEALELIENTTRGYIKGAPNAWRLKSKGEQVCRELETWEPH
jgi:hypothetical protein